MQIKSHLFRSAIAIVLGSSLFSGCLPNPATVQSRHSYTMPAETKLGAHTHDTKLEFKSQPASIVAGQPSIWLLKVLKTKKNPDTKQEEPVKEFTVVHEKIMHLVVVSKDLSWFNHIHPDYKDNGLFLIRMVLPRPGTYKLYADYTPKDGRQEVPQCEFNVVSSPAPNAQPVSFEPTARSAITADAPKGGVITKQIAALPEDEPQDESKTEVKTAAGPAYQIELVPPSQLRAEESTLLHFHVLDANGKEVTDLQPYLGAMGHAVILSADTNIYLHTHPISNDTALQMLSQQKGAMPKINNSDVFFPLLFPKAGIYKIWAQFRHHDQLITAPFTLKVGAAAKAANVGTANTLYVCPMHPEETSTQPNQTCPKCGMPLIQKTK
ncbi:MAG: hypothetical protein JO316_12685 [Abitibacteriaceae bacterium]|nr:hypothetical protein [Abditibacteriaceae bacterium]